MTGYSIAQFAGGLFVFLLTGCSQPAPQITVAAAANLTETFREIGTKFEAETGIHPVFSYASTAQLAQQAANGAPFDVIAAADTQHIDELDHGGFLTPGSKAVYARGALALWVPPSSHAAVRVLQDLTADQVAFIAIAKPELAPYGQAAVEALQQAHLWERVSKKVVYAENINVARQYGRSGNADAVFSAYALVKGEEGTVLRVDPKLYTPIDQALGVLARSAHPDAARKFTEFLLRGHGREILRDSGYEVPAPSR